MNEEKKAIETLKEVASDEFDTLGDDISPKMAQNILNVINNQQKEIEEKTTILLAGAEKVKQLEKGNRSLMESRIKWKDRYYKEKSKNKTLEELLQGNLYELYLYYKELASKYQANSISKDEVREKIKELSKAQDFKVGLENYTIKILKELIGEK